VSGSVAIEEQPVNVAWSVEWRMQPPDEVVRTPLLALLVTRHEQAVKAARSDAIAPHGTAASRKRYSAWRAAEAAFAESIAEIRQFRRAGTGA
jgi:hypothetical protein